MVQIRKRKLYEHVMEGMEEILKAEGLKPGDKLQSEKELSQFFGVSKTVIREALCALQAAGKIEVRHGAGIFVGKYCERDLRDAFQENETEKLTVSLHYWFELKRVLEMEAAELAAQRATLEEVMKIKSVLLDLSDHSLQGSATVILPQSFFAAVVAASQNPLFIKLHNVAERFCNHSQKETAKADEPRSRLDHNEERLEEYRMIYDAIKKKRPLVARKLVREHFERSDDL